MEEMPLMEIGTFVLVGP